jgi:hypothetical protein|tara:strand:- start:59 stop:445 length:387 start_codon:yes stop_codon:yes gene_type:complete
MKKALLLLLCAPLIGFGQQNTDVDSLLKIIDKLEQEVGECWTIIEMEDDCWCQVGSESHKILEYWDNGKKKHLAYIEPEKSSAEEPSREWYKNGKLKRMYIYGGCESNHDLVETICFDKKGREFQCEY